MEEYDICMGANLTCMNDHLNRMGKLYSSLVISSNPPFIEWQVRFTPVLCLSDQV